MTPPAVFRACGLTRTYRNGVRALINVDLTIRRNETLCILGPNGAGKSTLLRQLVGLDTPQSGYVSFDGRRLPLRGGDLKERVGYMPQGGAALNHMSSREALYHTARIRRMSRRAARRAADESLETWGLISRARHDNQLLSGGEQRLLRLAVTMIGEPPILVLDEPTANMDAAHRRRVYRVLDRLSNSTTIILVTHDPLDCFKDLGRVAILEGGRLHEARSADISPSTVRIAVTDADPLTAAALEAHGLYRDDLGRLSGSANGAALARLMADFHATGPPNMVVGQIAPSNVVAS